MKGAMISQAGHVRGLLKFSKGRHIVYAVLSALLIDMTIASAYQVAAQSSGISAPSKGTNHSCPSVDQRSTGSPQQITQSLVISSCMRSLVTKEDVGTYPQGIALSPDGSHVLVRIISKNLRFGLAVMSLPSRKLVATFVLNGDVVRPRWSPDGKHIAFFVLNDNETLRHLYVWTFHNSRARAIPDVRSYAEAQVAWSPDSKRIAYSDPNAGMVVVNLETLEHAVLTSEQPVSIFAWAPDSQSIASFAPDKPGRVIRMNLHGDIISHYDLREGESGRELAWTNDPSMVVLRTNVREGTKHKSRLSILDLRKSSETPIYESGRNISDPQWMSGGPGIVFLAPSAHGRDIFYLNTGTQQPVQLTAL